MYNSESSSLPPLALIAGPTASGKSALALALAEATGGIVINADASQVYAGLRVLSAAPTAEDEERAQHRLFGVVDPAIAWSAADWAAAARAAIAAAHSAGRLPILVGGTGLYLTTLIDGIAPVPAIDPAVRAEVRSRSASENYTLLSREDPAAAAALSPGDSARIARALEVLRATGKTIASWRAERAGGIGATVRLAATLLVPPRAPLYQRCADRFAAMLAGGAVEEVDALVARGLDPALPAMRTIGVREIGAWRDGRARREDAIAAAVTATRRYAKRQYTWFNHQPPATWQKVQEQVDNVLTSKIVIELRKYLLT
jgi:tRNA dimethylallyltransferase